MNKKAFTLIELLAVVIILGLLLAISVPSITRYIAQSRKKVYLNTLDSYADGLSKMIANSEIPGMYDKDTTYYIPFKCIAIEKGGGSPNGDWDFAYVMTTNVSNNRKYYFYTKDVKKISVEAIEASKLKNSDVKTLSLFAFAQNKLTELNLENGIVEIGDRAFMNNNISTATIPLSVIEIGAANFTYNPINRIYLTGRSSSAGMSLGANWNSYATVTYQP